MKSILVVGYGNTLRGDDGLGPYIARQISDGYRTQRAEVRVAILPQLDISLVSDLKDADMVIFVDARQDDDDQPVTVKPITAQATPAIAGHSTHCIGAAALLRITCDWYGAIPKGYLVTPKGYDFSISDRLSSRGLVAAAGAVEKITRIIDADVGR